MNSLLEILLQPDILQVRFHTESLAYVLMRNNYVGTIKRSDISGEWHYINCAVPLHPANYSRNMDQTFWDIVLDFRVSHVKFVSSDIMEAIFNGGGRAQYHMHSHTGKWMLVDSSFILD